jgi:CheY-like chemotaxis protein
MVTSVAPSDGTVGPTRVLVVDDYQDLADSLALMLRALGASARAAYDGQSALTAAVEFRPNLVFLDLGLPGMTGLEVARAIRREPELASAYIVAVSGWNHDEARRQSAEAGFNDYVVKPLALDTVQRLLLMCRSASGAND